MPLTKEQFDPKTLWPRAPFRAEFANRVTAETRLSQFGMHPEIGPLDEGALRVDERGIWVMFRSGFAGFWEEFNPRIHLASANYFNRYGAGWSEGPFLMNGHGMLMVETVLRGRGQNPSEMECNDGAYSRDIARSLGLLHTDPGANPPAVPPEADRPPAPLPSPPNTPPPGQPPAATPPTTPNPPVKPPADPLPPAKIPNLARAKNLAKQLVLEIERQEAALRRRK